MKNPLVVYTGAALASLAALAGLGMTDWSTNSPNDQKVPEIAGEVQPQASQETAKAPEKPAETAEVKAPEPPKAEAEVKPELDTVRVESDGQAVVAGRAKPGAEIALKLGDQVIGKGIANADGSWVVVPDNPLPKGAHEITVEQKAADSAPMTLEQSIAVAIPENTGRQAMVALTEPGSATKVLQAGDSQQQAQGSSGTAEPSTPEQPQTAEKPAETAEPAQTPPEDQKTAETAQQPAEAQQTAETARKSETTKPAGQAEKPAGETVAKTEELPTATKPPEMAQPVPGPAKTAKTVALRLDAVDYNDKGDIIFSGRAAPGTAIRLYVDNGGVGDAIVDSTGNWSFSGSDIIAPGTHTLRADQIDKAGKVMARIELPFQREDAAAVAALNAPPASETPAVRQPQTTDVQPPPATETPPQTTEVQQAPAAETPPQTTEVRPPPATETPQQTTEVAKTEPNESSPAPEPPATEDKKEDVATAAAAVAAAEQAAKATEPDKPRSGKVVIQPGNNLWKLSRVIYGRGINFTVIYKANKEQIRNPNRIYPGQIFAIPNATPPEMIDPKRKQPLTSAEGGAAQ